MSTPFEVTLNPSPLVLLNDGGLGTLPQLSVGIVARGPQQDLTRQPPTLPPPPEGAGVSGLRRSKSMGAEPPPSPHH